LVIASAEDADRGGALALDLFALDAQFLSLRLV
jgi:hypothetical protein